MAEFRVTTPEGDPLTVTADTAQITDGALLLGSTGSVPVGLFAAGAWWSAVSTAALPVPVPTPEPTPDPDPEPEPLPDAPTPEPDPDPGEPE